MKPRVKLTLIQRGACLFTPSGEGTNMSYSTTTMPTTSTWNLLKTEARRSSPKHYAEASHTLPTATWTPPMHCWIMNLRWRVTRKIFGRRAYTCSLCPRTCTEETWASVLFAHRRDTLLVCSVLLTVNIHSSIVIVSCPRPRCPSTWYAHLVQIRISRPGRYYMVRTTFLLIRSPQLACASPSTRNQKCERHGARMP
jgi:hypothetical protein